MTYDATEIKALGRLQTSFAKKGCIVCLCDRPYPISKEVYALPAKTKGVEYAPAHGYAHIIPMR